MSQQRLGENDRKRENVCGRGKSELEDSRGLEIVAVGLLKQVSLGKLGKS